MNLLGSGPLPPQDAYVAKQCPVRAQNEVLLPAVPLPLPPEMQHRFARALEFEQSMVDELVQSNLGATVVSARTAAAKEQATAAAMSRGSPLIIGGRLPTDAAGHRVGEPDLLVAATGGGYRAVDIKFHRALDPPPAADPGLVTLISPIHAPFQEDAQTNWDLRPRKREADLLQLAHYQRMLEASGEAPRGARWAGILGVERCVVWYDLDAFVWAANPGSEGHQRTSTMAVYDSRFEFRLQVVAAAAAHRLDPAIQLLAAPVKIGECAECRWWDFCRRQLEAGSGDVSLLPRIGVREWLIHRGHGVHDRGALARLDAKTARLVSNGVDVPELQRLAQGLPGATPLEELSLVARSRSQRARLEKEGVRTCWDLERLDSKTASYWRSGLSALPEHIDLARAALGKAEIYRRRGVNEVRVPRANVEVDVDMESTESGVYLWGALVTSRGPTPSTSFYRAHATWKPLTPELEANNFRSFWNWLTGVRRKAHQSQKSFCAYCYNASAENSQMTRVSLGIGLVEEVRAFIRSDEWVDLLPLVNSQLISGRGSGLKVIAQMAGFTWEMPDPGGGQCMVKYDLATAAVQPAAQDAARTWLLTYNRGDVQATLAIRNWLEEEGDLLPSISSLDPASA